ncbi:epoxide hydrolase family protein [Rhabdothermincola salaria]|uniref:epoxide hydrolase family protein n=1 Tax=Rhabdothermincola salaria TaxID=2903142 RepID=UPI001E3CE6A6|nr:epoxide hydrolase [Rhabdothermincola salaria]MCD9624385.1 epoxide hydrolase 1 [Rhabdothermincola salaria]
MTPQPFTIAVPDEVLEDLHRRLDNARWPDQAPGEPWSFGIPVTEVQTAVDHWRHRYDWRAREAAMNAWPHFLTEAQGEQVHFLHVRSPHDDATPLLLTHGWPGSFVEFLDLLGPLSDPEAHGGDAADAFHVVVPSMPGYGFSGPTRTQGVDSRRVASILAEVMSQLGYERFVAQGGDWGAVVTRWLGVDHPDRLIGLHVNMMFAFPGADDPDPMEGVTEADQERFATAGARIADGTGYMAIQSTRPQTLAYGLTDSPVGLAAWILEKFNAWSDLDEGGLSATYGWDRLLDNLMAYWVTNTAGSAARLYAESARGGSSPTDPVGQRVEVPSGHTVYPYELLQTPRAWAEKAYDLVYWAEAERGGHFAAFERPEGFVTDLRAFHRSLPTS